MAFLDFAGLTRFKNKLDQTKMAKPTNGNGTSGQILRSDGAGGSTWDNAATASEIGTAVTNWLNTNVPTGTTVAIDKSLTVSNAAADSETTGEKISDLDNTLHAEVSNDFKEINILPVSTGRYIRLADGAIATSSAWDASDFIALSEDAEKILYSCPQASNTTTLSTVGSLAFYSSNANKTSAFISSVTMKNGTLGKTAIMAVDVPSTARYIRVTIKTGAEDGYCIYEIRKHYATEDTLIRILEAENGLVDPVIISNYAVNVSGAGVSTSAWDVTSYTAIHGKAIAFTCPVVTNPTTASVIAALAFFSSGEASSFISCIPVEYGTELHSLFKVVDVPEGAKYYRASINHSLSEDYKIIDIHQKTGDCITKEIINLPATGDDTPVSETIVDIDPRHFYTIESYRMYGRQLTVSRLLNGSWTRVHLVNVNTGKESISEYQHGEYYIPGVNGSSRLRFKTEKSDANSLTLNLKEYDSLPYIRNEKRNTSYLPSLRLSNTLPMTRSFGIYNGYVYAFYNNTILRAALDGQTVETFYTHTYAIASAMIFENGNIMFTEAQDTNNKMYLLKNGTIISKHDFYDSTYGVRKTPSRLFSYQCSGIYGIVSEYYPSKTPTSGYHAYLTKDSGESWSQVFDLTTLIEDPATNEAHLHSVVYDKYGKMYWACNGDSRGIDMIWYSMNGTDWYATQEHISGKPTVIVPMRDCVMFISDTRQPNIFKWQRVPIISGDTLHFDTIHTFVHYWPGQCPIGAHAYYDEKNNVTYFGFFVDDVISESYTGTALLHAEVYVTDGYNTQQVYASGSVASLIGVYGDENHVVASTLTDTKIFTKI